MGFIPYGPIIMWGSFHDSRKTCGNRFMIIQVLFHGAPNIWVSFHGICRIRSRDAIGLIPRAFGNFSLLAGDSGLLDSIPSFLIFFQSLILFNQLRGYIQKENLISKGRCRPHSHSLVPPAPLNPLKVRCKSSNNHITTGRREKNRWAYKVQAANKQVTREPFSFKKTEK